MEMMIWLNLKIIAPPDQTAEVIRALRIHMRHSRVQPGCVLCGICQDVEEQNIIFYHEEWNSWREMEEYIRSKRFSWILELMEQSTNRPELSFNDISEIRGMEYVRNLRTADKN